MSPGEHEELCRQVEELVSKGYVHERMSPCTQPRGPLDLMSFHVSGSVTKKVQDFVEGLPYHGDSSDDNLVKNSRTNFVYPWGNDAGSSVEERALFSKGARPCEEKAFIQSGITWLNFQKRNKDMLSSKWHTLNHNCQKFNAIYKRCRRLSKSGENELDVMKRARTTYRDKNKNTPFIQEDALKVLRTHSKWDAPSPAPVDLTEDEHIPAVNTDELFGPDARPRPPGKQRPGKKTKSDTSASTGGSSSSSQWEIMTQELRLKREAAEKAFEVAKEIDRTVMRLEEMKFLAIITKDLSEDDAYFINEQKHAIRDKYQLYRK
ncbi:hypothetical protein Tco_0973866 [Tanacetum coccineum]|uniref:No apical meristem-associated C-terminal domain-containing protein n=1 Tax=Tanacetum coccineum TaxID=301880 RepID=A0ABQ5EA00_9ASTR